MKEKWKRLNRESKKRVLLLLLIMLMLVVIPGTFALYKEFFDVSVTTVAGEMISDIEIDSNENYVENNIPYFYIIVKNYREIGNTTLLSATAFDYTLYIENKGGSNGLFTYVDESGNSSNEAKSTLAIENCHLNQDKDSNKYKIYVTREGTLKTIVDYQVRIDAHQSTIDK